jgi:hypothetical protein
MPPDIRHVYERALATVRGETRDGLPNVSRAPDAPVLTKTKIVFKNHEYASVGEMPAEIRRSYDELMATLDAPPSPTAGAAAVAEPGIGRQAAPDAIRPESTNVRLVIAAVVIAAALFASFVFGR